MRPLNGHSRMTPEEKNARRRELDKDPFHHELSLRTARAWRAKNPEKIAALNARRRAKYAENKEKEHARAKAWREAHKDDRNASYKLWAKRNKSKLREKWKARAADPVAAERRRELRRKRMQDPQRRKHVNWLKRLYYHTHKNDAIGLKWLVNTCWLPRWKEVVKEGPLKIAKYRQRCCVRTRSYFDRWLKQMGIAIPNAVEAAKPFDPLAGLGL